MVELPHPDARPAAFAQHLAQANHQLNLDGIGDEPALESAIETHFGFTVPVIVRSGSE